MKNKQKLSIIKLNLLQRRNMYAFLFILLLYECVDYVIIQKIYKKKNKINIISKTSPTKQKKRKKKKQTRSDSAGQPRPLTPYPSPFVHLNK